MCGRSVWFSSVDSTSLTVHGDLNHIIVASCLMFTTVDWVAWVNVGGWCYRVVWEHASPLGLDGQCLGHAYMSIGYVLPIFVVYVLVAYAWCWSWLQWCFHVNFDGVVVECVVMSIWLVMCFLYMSSSYLLLVYIDMLVVVMYEVMVCVVDMIMHWWVDSS